MSQEKYLPLGTVVLLEGGQHRIMIVGFCSYDASVDHKMYDYLACFYPEGIFSLEKMIAFNHSDIAKIYQLGYSDEEEKKFKKHLVEAKEKFVDSDGNMKLSPGQIKIEDDN